jgi:hypothetical protein
MRELLWAGTEVSAFKETTFVAEHFSRGKVGTSPSGGIGGTTVVALSPDTVS